MSSPNPDKQPSDALRRLEALPSSIAGGTSDGTPEENGLPGRPWPRYALIGAGVLSVGLILWFALTGPILPPGEKPDDTGTENGIDQARKALSRDSDLAACRAAMQQINTQMNADKQRPPALSPERRDELQKRFDLDESALAEIESARFSRLDAIYLEQALLFRDAARAIEVTNLPGASEAALRSRYLDRVQVAFAWTVRQVRLEEETEQRQRIDPLLLPPAYVLRRGVGTPLERALVFLALLEQMDSPDKIQGCLVFCPQTTEGDPSLWAVGVALGGKNELYLFDPRLGLPLPGKDGAGVATLAEILKEPNLLTPLNLGGLKYSPAGATVAKADLRYVVSLSALAPRTAYLQEQILGTAVPVRLAQEDARIQTQLDAAAKLAGLAHPVRPWMEGKHTTPTGEITLSGPELLRRFFLDEEGGSDKKEGRYLTVEPEALRRFLRTSREGRGQPMPRQPAWQLSAVPFEYYPPVFQDQERFPLTVGMGQRVYSGFATPFLRAFNEPGQPRDQILRGRYTQAAPGLVAERDRMTEAENGFRQALAKGDLNKRLDEWIDQAIKLYADEVQATTQNNQAALQTLRREIDDHWRKGEVVGLVLTNSVARPRLPQVVYQIALCKHEMAEHAQSRLEFATALGLAIPKLDRTQTLERWRDALDWWRRFAQNHPGAPGQAAVRRWHARALTCLGEPAEARTLLRELSPPILPMEQIAMLYLAGK